MAEEILEGQKCPMCGQDSLTLMETSRDIPSFGEVFIFSMDCGNCDYHKADVEPADKKESSKYTMDVNSENDMEVRIVKSSSATIKIPHMFTMEAGPTANGYVTNIEGVLNRVKHQLQASREEEEDKSAKDKAKRMLKKLQRVMWGQDSLKLIVEDPEGNSAIVSEKAKVTKL